MGWKSSLCAHTAMFGDAKTNKPMIWSIIVSTLHWICPSIIGVRVDSISIKRGSSIGLNWDTLVVHSHSVRHKT